MKVLHLTLKKKWFDMIASGEKKEEYREQKPYWWERLVKTSYPPSSGFEYKFGAEGDVVVFTNGYSRNAPKITVEIDSIEQHTGRPEWGAVPGVEYFVIKLGKVL